MNKVIILDYGIFLHRAGYASIHNPTIPVAYTCLRMMISCLRRIGVNKDDIIIVACDGRGIWRKQYSDEYKAGRNDQRKKSGIDWDKLFKEFDGLLEDIEVSTGWTPIKIKTIEADDIMAVASRFYKDKEVVLVTYDSDMFQLWEYPHVKIFSPKTKEYKIPPKNFNPYKHIAKKIEKEVSDGLVSPILTKEDYETRKMLVNLLELPDFIEQPITTELEKIAVHKMESNISLLPFKSLRKEFDNIYNSTKVITFEDCVKKLAKKEAKKKKKKDKLKAQAKKLKAQKKKGVQDVKVC